MARQGFLNGCIWLAAMLALTLSCAVNAQAVSSASNSEQTANHYPNRPIKMIVGYPPGGPNDQIARLLSTRLTDALKQSVVVENKPGSNSEIAAALVASAPADGYTLLLGSSGPLSIAPSLSDKLSYNPLKDFTPIALIGYNPMLVLLSTKTPLNNVPELIAYAKANPGKLTFASAGNGGPTHLSAELFKTRAGIDMLHVPYKGGGPAMTDLISGQVDMYFGGVSTALPHVQSGRLKAIAITSEKRSELVPEIPALSEFGLHGYSSVIWYGLLAPAGLPPAIVSTLGRLTKEIATSPEFKKLLSDQGAQPQYLDAKDFDQFIKDDAQMWSDVVKSTIVKRQ